MRAVPLRLTIVFVLFLTVLPPAASSAPPEDIPYLYYYSDLLHAFVIERADGTDSRTLAADVMSEDHSIMSGPGWSPSGRWFAWTSSEYRGPGYAPAQGWIISADGTRRLTLLDDFYDIHAMIWSPTEDLLFVSGYRGTSPQTDVLTYYLIDVDAETIIVTLELQGEANDSREPAWLPDGSAVAIFHEEQPFNAAEPSRFTVLRTISRTGDITERLMHVLPNVSYTEQWGFGPRLSSMGWILYYTPDQTTLIAENLITGDLIEFLSVEHVKLVGWNTSGDASLLRNADTGDMWYLSILEGDVVQVATGAQLCSTLYSYTSSMQVWSPTRNQAVFAIDGDLYLFDANALQLIPLPGMDDQVVNQWVWTPNGEALLIGIESEGTGDNGEIN